MKTNFARTARFEFSAEGMLVNLVFLIYVLLLISISIGWPDGLAGGIAEIVTSIFNPYLPNMPAYGGAGYFVRCHVLAFLMSPLLLLILCKSRMIRAQARLIARERKARLSNFLLLVALVLFLIYIPSQLHIHPNKSVWGYLLWMNTFFVPLVAFGFARILMTLLCTCIWLTKYLLSED